MSTSLSFPVCRKFSIKEIEKATNQFDKSRILGQGAEAKVYRAEMHIGSNKTAVAVKHYLNETKDFEKEIQIYFRIQHPNIVSLLGYCNESGHQVLVYEYMENGCLSDYLKKNNPTPLSWLQRLSICLDVACGLQHIHTPTPQFSKGIVHRDVKPGNILLNKNWVGKLSDFGIIKLSQADQEKSQMPTTIKGTSGYFAPEYHRFRLVTRKIDVYSFGVVLFKVLCRKSPWDRDDESYYPDQSDDDLGEWAQQNIDPQIREEISIDSVNLYTAIIGKSLNRNPHIRPSMEDIVLDLRKALECQNSRHSQKLTKLPELPVEGTTIPSFRPESSSRFSIQQINSALLAYFSEDKMFSVDDINAALLPFSTFKRISLKKFSSNEIKAATNQFDNNNIIGKGETATVYFAEMYIDSNKVPVALKYLNCGAKSKFKKMIPLSKNEHHNLVSLIGYCDESDYLCLVYEYMAKGCLSDYLTGTSPICLSWRQRINICLNVACGLEYLHTPTRESPNGVIFRDVNPEKILVDENWVGKLSDSNAREYLEQTHMSTMITDIKGLKGNFAPEYVRYKRITRKLDVFSFGVVLIRVLCPKKEWDQYQEDLEYYFIEEGDLGLWAKENVDAEIQWEISGLCLAIYTDLIGRCLKKDPDKRPTMKEVVMDLQNAIKYQNYSDEAK